MDEKIYDLIIIGSGPSGMTASIYASRYKLDHLILGVQSGGQMGEIWKIENYPGSISQPGSELMAKMIEHVKSFGVDIRNESVVAIDKEEGGESPLWRVRTARNTYPARSIILAMGAQYRKMNIPGEKELTGKGVSYCATCDAMFFRDKVVGVIGGGNSAAVVALELTGFAKKVYLIYRGEKLSAEPLWVEKINENSKIELIKGTNVVEMKGADKLEKVILDNPYQDKTFLEVDGVFIEVGSEPGVELAQKIGVETDEKNYIKVKNDQSTNVEGIYAAGDITDGSNGFRQVLTACAEGAIAAASAYKKIKLKQ